MPRQLGMTRFHELWKRTVQDPSGSRTILSMASKTPIQWCDSAVNPIMGCCGCELWSGEGSVPPRCYAAFLHLMRGGISKGYAPWFGLPTLFPGRTSQAASWSDLSGTKRQDKPWLDGLPRLIFTSDMGDALSPGEYRWASDLERYEVDGKPRYRPAPGKIRTEGGVPFTFLEQELIDVASSQKGRRHIWQWLTKLPGRGQRFVAWLAERGKRWPENLWIGTSVTSAGSLGRVRELVQMGDERTLRFVSVEPLWGPVSLVDFLERGQVQWVIVGGESKQGKEVPKPFNVDWAREIRDDCGRFGVPLFVKQLGSSPFERSAPLRLRDGHGGAWAEWPTDLRVRELPSVA